MTVPVATEEDKRVWAERIGAWRAAHPQYKDYIIKPGFGGPGRTPQEAKREALQDAYQQFGAALDLSQLDVLEEKDIQVASGFRFFYFSDVYVGFDRHREDLQSVLTIQLATLQRSLPKAANARRVLSAIGWPVAIAGGASMVMAVVSTVFSIFAYDKYKTASTSPVASQYRHETELWSVILTASTAGAAALPLGSLLLIVRPDPTQIQQQIDKIIGVLNTLPRSMETAP
jgi:hypothetical protein